MLHRYAVTGIQGNINSRGENYPHKQGFVKIGAEPESQNKNRNRVYPRKQQSPQGCAVFASRALPRGQYYTNRRCHTTKQKNSPLRIKSPSRFHQVQPRPQKNKNGGHQAKNTKNERHNIKIRFLVSITAICTGSHPPQGRQQRRLGF